MDKYVCDICGYVYDPAEGDPDNGVAPGTAWESVPESWVCPLCGVGKGTSPSSKTAQKNACTMSVQAFCGAEAYCS